MRVLPVVVLVCAGWAWAQGPAVGIYLSSPEPRLVAGEQVQLAATSRDSTGRIRSGDSFTWTSSDPAVASVSSGVVTALRPGFADITAAIGNVRSNLRLQVLPLRIDVSPRRRQIVIGESIQYSAVALNLNGDAIPDVPFQWQITGANGSNTVAASIDRNGLLRAAASAIVTVRAIIQYPGAPGQFTTQYVGLAQVEIRPPADFRLTRMLSTEDARTFVQLRPRRNTMAMNERGQIATPACFDGLSNALLLFDNGRIDVLVGGGTPAATTGGVVFDFQDPAINSRGDVVARTDTLGIGGALVLASRSGYSFIMTDGESAGGIVDLRNFAITRSSINDQGDVLFRASFRIEGSNDTLTGLFRYSAGVVQLEWSSDSAPPGLRTPVVLEQEFGIAANRVVYFRAFDGGGRGIFRKEGFGQPVKLLAEGDRLGGEVVQSVAQVVVGPAGDLVITGYWSNGGFIARYARGIVSSPPQVFFLRNLRTVSGVNSAGRVVFTGDAGRGFGVHVWDGGDTADIVLARNEAGPNGEMITEIDAAGITAQGEITAQVRTATNSWMFVSAGRLLFQSGDPVSVAANLVYRQPIGGARAGPPHLLMGGGQASVFEVDVQGPLPKVVLGDRPTGGAVYTGFFPVRKNPSGDLYVTAEDGIYRLAGGRADVLVSFPIHSENSVDIFRPNTLMVNERGGMAWIAGTNDNHNRLQTVDGTRVTTLAYLGTNPRWLTRSPDGGTFNSANELAIDESGRVMAQMRVDGGPSGYFLYANGSWKSTALFTQTQVGGLAVTGARELKAGGQKFYAVVNLAGGSSALAEFADGQWAPVITRGTPAPNGNLIDSFGTFDVNRRGEIAFLGNLNGSSALLAYSEGSLRLVHLLSRPTEAGDYLRFVDGIDFRDTRTVYFTGLDLFDRYLLYAAEPNF
jgi:hypothetical protein